MKQLILRLLLSLMSAASSDPLWSRDLLAPELSPAALLRPLPALAQEAPADNQSTTGDLSRALSTMHFHRSMMNEYLCHNYLADDILSNLEGPMESRSGEPAVSSSVGDDTVGQDLLLADPGSKGYRQWLKRSAQLEDMYGKSQKVSDLEAYETGDVTGYATVHGGKEQGGGGWSGGGGGGWSNGGGGGSSDGGGSGGWGSGGAGWSNGASGVGGGAGWNSGAEPGWDDDSGGLGWHDNSGHGVTGWGGWEENESGKGLALKDLFDLALTALAFLAFGLFVLNLIMICLAKAPSVAVEMTGSTTAAPGRLKRETSHQLNELAYRVLTSVDKLLELQREDSENSCFEYTLCDNNKYSRALNDKNRIWLPAWSLGMSWVANRHGRGAGLGHIRASVLGLGDADCAALYPRCKVTKRSK